MNVSLAQETNKRIHTIWLCSYKTFYVVGCWLDFLYFLLFNVSLRPYFILDFESSSVLFRRWCFSSICFHSPVLVAIHAILKRAIFVFHFIILNSGICVPCVVVFISLFVAGSLRRYSIWERTYNIPFSSFSSYRQMYVYYNMKTLSLLKQLCAHRRKEKTQRRKA